MPFRVQQLILFDVRDTILIISKEILLADMYGIDLHDLGDITFSAWVDYNESHRKFWSDNNFNPADSISEYIHEMFFNKMQSGSLPYQVENELYKIVPSLLHACMYLFLTIVELLNRYITGDKLGVTFNTLNSCDFVVELQPATLRY